MSKKVSFFFLVFVLFSFYHSAYASLVINEVMYDLSGSDSTSGKSREWIEIYNPDASDVSVSAASWRIYDGSNHTINDSIDFSIPTNSCVIFAGDKDTFLADNPGFTGAVYDTGISSLNNTGATLKLLDQDGNTVDSFTYASSQGGAGDGNSLQKISGAWSGAAPTPGVTNEASPVVPPPSGGGGTGSSASNSSSQTTTTTTETKQKPVEEPKIKTKIITKNIVLAGNPLPFQVVAFGYNKEKLFYGKYFLNFGDGDSKEIQANNMEAAGKMTHTYYYPGDYVMTLEYYMNSYGNVSPDAVDQMTVRVAGSDVLISAVGNEKDFFVELTNNTEYDADISLWILASAQTSFTFPKNTIISPKKKLTVSSRLTHFSLLDKNTLKLLNQQNELVFDYGAFANTVIVLDTTPVAVSNNLSKREVPVKPLAKVSAPQTPEILELPVAEAHDLAASVAETEIGKGEAFPYTPALAFIFIGASAGAVYYVRRKAMPFKAGDDFKILDE